MIFLYSCGLHDSYQLEGQVEIKPDQLDDEQAAILLEECEAFLQSNGTLSPYDWAKLTEVEKAALALAGERVRARYAVDIGEASQSTEGLLNVASQFDNGESADRMSLAIMCAQAAETTRTQPVAR